MPSVSSENEIVKSELSEQAEPTSTTDVSKTNVGYDTKVYVTAEFLNHESQLSEVDVKSLKSVLKSRDHLCRNVTSITYGPVKTYRENSQSFKHYMPFLMEVDVSKLWENPRSYIYHHLGRDTWTFSNGTVLELRRIHQKQQ